ncbi:MAG: T9SS type A sorting domain-containing protein [Candidatus Aegiribacteria sp.]|nr:T9SS type A sorting domain-containing protein [Candidatus Aegiribacteria sp.]
MYAVRSGFCLMVLSVVTCFAFSGDLMLNDHIGHSELPDLTEEMSVVRIESDYCDQPTFTVSHTESGGDITVHVTSNEDLYEGWVSDKEIWNHANWDYWWLNTRISSGADNMIYAAVKLYQYSSTNSNFDMYVLENNGDISEQNLNWNGPGNNPLIINNPFENIYLEQPTLDPEGIVDVNNVTYIFSGSSNISFTKIDANGTILVSGQTIITGANAWTNGIRTAVTPNGRIYIVWSCDMHDITCSYSDDGGTSWATPISLCYNVSDQLNKPQICCDSNGNAHIIWQHWTGSSNLLSYMKLYPDGSICIDESFLTASSNQVWAPQMDIDEENNIHIVWARSSQQITSAYYTKINGNLDGAGQSMSDSDLTLIQEAAFLSNEQIRYTKCSVDGYMNVHVIFERGEYGCNEAKSVYYIKRNSIPMLRVEFPDDSVIFVEMTGSGTVWEGTFASSGDGTYSVWVSGSNSIGDTGADFYEFDYPGTGIETGDCNCGLINSIRNYPNPFGSQTAFVYSLSGACEVSIRIFDIRGRLIGELIQGEQIPGTYSVNWSPSDVDSGMYFYRINAGSSTETGRCLIISE